MFFTREDILKIQQALLQLGVKDSELSSAESVTYDDILSIVQDGKNKQIRIKDFFNQISLWKREDFLNITDRYDEHYIMLLEAINLVPILQRKDGLVITFQDIEGNWRIYQFRGNITEFLDEEKWFDLYDYRNYIVKSIIPDEEDLTASTPDKNGNSLVSLKDRIYTPAIFSGKGYKFLRKNIINVKLATIKISVTNPTTLEGDIEFNINNKSVKVHLSPTIHNTTKLVSEAIKNALVVAYNDYEVTVTNSVVTLTRKYSGSIPPTTFEMYNTGVRVIVEDSTTINEQNVITQEDINKSDTIYEIRYDFTLDGKTITIPKNCILYFTSGKFYNGIINMDNTVIATLYEDILSGVNVSGNYYNIQKNIKDANNLIQGNINKLNNAEKNIERLNTRSSQIEETIKGIAATGGASVATSVTYNNKNSGLTAVNTQAAIDETNNRISNLDSSDYRQDLTITYLEDKAKGKINIDSLYIKLLNLNPIPTIFKLRVYKDRKIGDYWFDGFAIIVYGDDYPSEGLLVCKNYIRELKSDPSRFETNYLNKLIKLSDAKCEAYIKVISANTNANTDFVIKNRSFYPNPTYNEYYIENKKVSIPDNVATVDNLNVVDNKVEQLKNSLDTQSQQILTVENQVTNKLNEFQEIIDSEENKSKFIGVFNLSSELPTEGIKDNSYAYANNPRTEWLFKNGRWEDTGIEMPITVLSEKDYVKNTAFYTTIKELRFGKENTLEGEYIYISTQEEFDNLLANVKQKIDEYIALSTKDLYTISILIHGGIYKFSSIQKLELDSYTKAYNISINISAVPGEKVYVISDGQEFTPENAISLTSTHYICNISDYNTSYAFVDQDFNYIKVQNTGNVNPLCINLMTERPTFNLGLKQIKFKIPDELSILKNKELEYFKNSYLYFTCQWFDYTAHNIYSDDTYIYATYDTSGENINAIEMDVVDEKYDLPTRFYITNIPDIKLDANQVLVNNNKIYIPRNISKLYLMKYSNLFKFKNLHFSNIVLSNINFVGSVYNQSSLIEFMDCNNVYCNYNTFKNINSFNCITVNGSASSYTPNKETHTGTQTYYSVNNNISYNKFIDIGVSVFKGGKVSGVEFSYNYLYNTSILRCKQAAIFTGKDNHISYNKFINIPFNSIYLLGPINYFTAVVEYNEFYNTNDYNNTYIAHSLIDGGVIYAGWHSDGTIIRYNIFHDKRSYANHRGIMVDSGGYNVSIYGNLFYRIQNSFTIDLRQVTATNDMEIRDRNTNNFVYDNIIVGTCKLMGNPEHPNEVYLGNNIYCTKYSTNKTNVTTNAKLTGKLIEDSNLFIENDIIYLTKNPNFNISPFIKSRLVIGV